MMSIIPVSTVDCSVIDCHHVIHVIAVLTSWYSLSLSDLKCFTGDEKITDSLITCVKSQSLWETLETPSHFFSLGVRPLPSSTRHFVSGKKVVDPRGPSWSSPSLEQRASCNTEITTCYTDSVWRQTELQQIDMVESTGLTLCFNEKTQYPLLVFCQAGICSNSKIFIYIYCIYIKYIYILKLSIEYLKKYILIKAGQVNVLLSH